MHNIFEPQRCLSTVHTFCFSATFSLSNISILAINVAFTVSYVSSILLDVDGSSDVLVDRTVWLSHVLLMEMDDVTLHFFVGGNGIRTGADHFLGEANFFPSVKEVVSEQICRKEGPALLDQHSHC